MEQRPEGTPNPLNPNMDATPLDANPSEPVRPSETSTAAEVMGIDIMTAEPAAEPAVKPATEPTVEPTAAPEPAKKFRPLKPMSSVRPRGPIDMVKPIPDKMQAVRPADKAKATFVVDPMVAVPAANTPAEDDLADNAPVEDILVEAPTIPSAPRSIDMVQPTQFAQPAQPLQPTYVQPERPAQIAQPIQPTQPVQSAQPVPTDPTNTLGVVTNMDGTVAEAIDPTNRPMQKAVTETPKPPKKRHRKGLIVGAIICLFVAIGCGVAAALILIRANQPDPVAMATKRMVSGEAPGYLMADGTIDINTQNNNSPFNSLRLKVSTEAVTSSLINSTIIQMDAESKSGRSFSTTLSEIYAANGDIYLKVDGATEFLAEIEAMGTPGALVEISEGLEIAPEEASNQEAVEVQEEVEMIPEDEMPEPISDDVDTSSVAALTEFFETVETMDGDWLRIPVNSLESLLPSTVANNNLTCAVKFAMEANNNNVLTSAYLSYPFVSSADEEISVASERDPIYKVLISDARLSNFVLEAQNSSALSNLTNCLGYEGAATEALVAEANNLPELFVEVDDEYNFTRLYFTANLDGGAEIATDFRFSYPVYVNVPEPTEYIDYSTAMQEVDKKLQSEQGESEEVPAEEQQRP